MREFVRIELQLRDRHADLVEVTVCTTSARFSQVIALADVDDDARRFACALRSIAALHPGNECRFSFGDTRQFGNPGSVHFFLLVDARRGVRVMTEQFGDNELFADASVVPSAKLLLRTEPALVDRFVVELEALAGRHGNVATLECV